MARGKTLTQFVIFLFILILFFASGIATLYTDYYWFSNLGFSSVFLTILWAKLSLFIVGAFVFLAIAFLNLWFAHSVKGSAKKTSIKYLVTVAFALIAGSYLSGKWATILTFINRVDFLITDPIFANDVGFYVFSLPFIQTLWSFALIVLIGTFILIAITYLQKFGSLFIQGPRFSSWAQSNQQFPGQGMSFSKGWKKVSGSVKVHLGAFLTALFVLIAIKHWIDRYFILLSSTGAVFGAGYTDTHINLPVLLFMAVVALVVGIIVLLWVLGSKAVRARKVLIYAVGTYLVLAIVGLGVVPSFVQHFVVSPNEITLETPYIENNIKFTREAYGLTDVAAYDFPADGNITRQVIENNPETINNLRLQDWKPLMQTYKQLQEIRLYYDFKDVDIDRYMINGDYRQVMLSPREMAQGQLATEAKTWLNQHLVYTHGYGVVVSPVNLVDDQGLPVFFVKDIPPKNLVGDPVLDITRPEIYYGESSDTNFVLVNTLTKEFDYPKGDSNVYTEYNGRGGVQIDSFLKRLMFAIRFSDLKVLVSGQITPQSRIMYYRNVQSRIAKLMPFLLLDDDPYMVIDEGRLVWVQDAYTISDRYPYSKPLGGVNYIRNSVKVVVDAFDGDVTFYVTDFSDPLIRTYSRIFPGAFKPLSDMKESLHAHLRYPELLFRAQSEIYGVYHMSDPTVFYNKEDEWNLPFQVYSTNSKVRLDPYYMIMKLPGYDDAEFLMLIPFTPRGKDNMIAWMAARSDGENYGDIVLYKFPKDKLIYGPMQIEARVDQDSEISQQLTLWSQKGSSVLRGNLLVVPISDALLYIEPLYIIAERSELPELKRIIVSFGNEVAMEETLDAALTKLFGTPTYTEQHPSVGNNSIAAAQQYYEGMQSALAEGNWTSYGEYYTLLGEVLASLNP